MHSFRRIVTSQCKRWRSVVQTKKYCSDALVSVSESIDRANLIFSQEQKRQLEDVGRVEKVEVVVRGPPENVVLMMNQNISTPYDCCKHISLPLCHQSPLALINNSILWDMHRPLPGECELKFLSFRDEQPFAVNEAFWRTGSFILGAVIMRSFKEETGVVLTGFPEVKVTSGSFIYDVAMKLVNWTPTVDEIKVLSGEFLTFVKQNHKIERLDVKKSVAMEIFDGNESKEYDIKRMAAESEDHLVTLYRVGNHIDVAAGPMVGDTSFFGRCSVAAIHPICGTPEYPFYRFQGVALPKGILLNSFAYGIVLDRAKRLNELEIIFPNERISPYGTGNIVPKNSNTPVSANPLSIDTGFQS